MSNINIRKVKDAVTKEEFYPQTCIEAVVDENGDALDIDASPTDDSDKLVRSGGVKAVIDNEASARADADSALGTRIDDANIGIQAALAAVSAEQQRAVQVENTKYSKPAGGIPKVDLASDVRNALDLATDVVYDISAHHSNTAYASLASALGTNGANIPQGLRKGGMSIKYVQSSDNNYIQARLMANSFTTDVTKWQVVDDEPTAGSNNLVKSGGVKKEMTDTAIICVGLCLSSIVFRDNVGISTTDGGFVNNKDTIVSESLLEIPKGTQRLKFFSRNNFDYRFCAALFDANNTFVARVGNWSTNSRTIDISSYNNVKYVRLGVSLYVDGQSAGGDHSIYDLDSLVFTTDKSVTDDKLNEVINPINSALDGLNEDVDGIKNFFDTTVVLLAQNTISYTQESGVYGKSVVLSFSDNTNRCLIVKKGSKTSNDINIIPEETTLTIPNNKNLWINLTTKKFVVNDLWELDNALFVGRCYYGYLSGGIFDMILPFINKNSINAINGQISTINGQISTIGGQISTIGGQIDALNGRVSAIEDNVDTVNAYLYGIKMSEFDFTDNKGISPADGEPIYSQSILCDSYIPTTDSEVYFYTDLGGKSLNVCIGCYENDGTFISRINWTRDPEKITLVEGTGQIRIALGLFDEEGDNIGRLQENYDLDKIVFSFGKTVKDSLEELEKTDEIFSDDIEQLEEQVDYLNENVDLSYGHMNKYPYSYDGEKINMKPKLRWKQVAQSTHASALQGGAAFGNYYFQFHGQNNKNGQGQPVLFYGIEIFDLQNGNKVQEILLGFDLLKHNNSVNFSNVYYDNEDIFPLLYASQENADARYITVYRITETLNESSPFKVTMVQVIQIPPVSQSNFTFPNAFVGDDILLINGFDSADSSKYANEVYVLPAPTDGTTVPVSTISIVDGYGETVQTDGYALDDGVVVKRNDNDDGTAIKYVKLDHSEMVRSFKFDRTNPYSGANATTQGGCISNGTLYQSFGSNSAHGGAVLKAIDISDGNVKSTINLTGIGLDAEPETVYVYCGTLGAAFNGNGKIVLFDFD